MASLSLLLLGIGLFQYAVAGTCPSNLPAGTLTTEYGQYCFAFSGGKVKVSHNKAAKECMNYGGFLASDPSDDINKALVMLMKRDNYEGEAWIGLSDEQNENEFKWDDGSNFLFENWADNEGPRKGIRHHFEDCVGLSSVDQKWHDHRCGGRISNFFSNRLPFICEFITPTTAPSTTMMMTSTPTMIPDTTVA